MSLATSLLAMAEAAADGQDGAGESHIDHRGLLRIGTQVLTRFRGAFVVGTITVVAKPNVVCTVEFERDCHDVPMDLIRRGDLAVNEVVSAKHPEHNIYKKGEIVEVSDLSAYTIEFDDGDTCTAGRSSIHLPKARLQPLVSTPPEGAGSGSESGSGSRRPRRASVKSSPLSPPKMSPPKAGKVRSKKRRRSGDVDDSPASPTAAATAAANAARRAKAARRRQKRARTSAAAAKAAAAPVAKAAPPAPRGDGDERPPPVRPPAAPTPPARPPIRACESPTVKTVAKREEEDPDAVWCPRCGRSVGKDLIAFHLSLCDGNARYGRPRQSLVRIGRSHSQQRGLSVERELSRSPKKKPRRPCDGRRGRARTRRAKQASTRTTRSGVVITATSDATDTEDASASGSDDAEEDDFQFSGAVDGLFHLANWSAFDLFQRQAVQLARAHPPDLAPRRLPPSILAPLASRPCVWEAVRKFKAVPARPRRRKLEKKEKVAKQLGIDLDVVGAMMSEGAAPRRGGGAASDNSTARPRRAATKPQPGGSAASAPATAARGATGSPAPDGPGDRGGKPDKPGPVYQPGKRLVLKTLCLDPYECEADLAALGISV